MSLLSDPRLVVRPDTIQVLQDAEAWMIGSENRRRSATEHRFGIFDRGEPGHCLGSINLQHLERVGRITTLDGWVRASQTGTGSATDAARLVARFGLTAAEFDRIDLRVAIDDDAAQRVAESLS